MWDNGCDDGIGSPCDSGSVGNYYSDYTSTDGDGIDNGTHPIPGGNNTDRYPLMHPWAAATPPQKGDLNGDDQIADAAIALQLAASGGWDPAADVNHDSRITSLDALMILQAATAAIEL